MEQKARRLSDDGKYMKAFSIIQQIIMTKKHQQAQDTVQYAVQMSQVFNQFGMKLLDSFKYQESQQLFEKIIKVLKTLHGSGDDINQSIGLTLNNLSCSLKRNGQIKEAQACLQRAIKYQNSQNAQNDVFERSPQGRSRGIDDTERFLSSPRNKNNEIALTQLNMCAILSQRGEHQQALEHVKSSIEKLDAELNYLLQKVQSMNAQQLSQSDTIIRQTMEKQSLLAIAYYNQGCQQEFLKMYQRSMESYLTAYNLEKTKNRIGGDENQPPNPILKEFEKSYKEMKKKIHTMKVAHSNSQAAYTHTNKRTFSGLDKKVLDHDSEYSKKFQTVSSSNRFYNNKKNYQSGVYIMNKDSSKVSFQKNDLLNFYNLPKIDNNTSQERKKRPMSAKNPTLKFRNEQSTPKLPEGELVSIQKEVIDEENQDYQMVNENDLSSNPYNNPMSKARKIRPVSSYVQKKDLLQQPSFKESSTKQDQLYISATNFSQRNLNDPSERFSNIDSISNLGITKTNDYQQKVKAINIRKNLQKSSRGNTMVVESEKSLPPKAQNFSSKLRKEVRKMSKITQQRTGRTSNNNSNSSVQLKSFNTQRRTIIDHGIDYPGLPSNKPVKLRGKLNEDIATENLIDAIDRNYKEMSQMSSHRPSVRNNMHRTQDMGAYDIYATEMLKQQDYRSDLRQLSKDIQKLDRENLPAEIVIKQKLIRKRPQTAKPKTKHLQSIRTNFEIIDEQTINEEVGENEENAQDVVERNSAFHQQRFSISRSRSRSKSQQRKNAPANRERPRSAYTKPNSQFQGVTLQKFNETKKSLTKQLKTRSQPSLGVRIQSAGPRRENSTQRNMEQNPYQAKKIRPQNRPTKIRDNYGSGLGEIDEYSGNNNSNSDTQIIYSGNHSNPSIEKPVININNQAMTMSITNNAYTDTKIQARIDPTDYQKQKASERIDEFASDALKMSIERKKESIQETINRSRSQSPRPSFKIKRPAEGPPQTQPKSSRRESKKEPLKAPAPSAPKRVDLRKPKAASMQKQQPPKRVEPQPQKKVQAQPQKSVEPQAPKKNESLPPKKVEPAKKKPSVAAPPPEPPIKKLQMVETPKTQQPTQSAKANVRSSKGSTIKKAEGPKLTIENQMSSVTVKQSSTVKSASSKTLTRYSKQENPRQNNTAKFGQDSTYNSFTKSNQMKSSQFKQSHEFQQSSVDEEQSIVINLTKVQERVEFEEDYASGIIKSFYLRKSQGPEFLPMREQIERDPERPDLNQYPEIDPDRPLADQLDVSSNGSSGPKSGESEFDEEYYEEYQEWQRQASEKQDEYLKTLQDHGLDQMFFNNYEKYLRVKQQLDLANKFYNPYSAIRDENKKQLRREQTIAQLKEIHEEETKQTGEEFIESLKERLFTQYSNLHKRQEAFKQYENTKIGLGLVNTLIPDNRPVDQEQLFKDLAFTGQIKDLLVPIREDQFDVDLDQERADALLRFKDFPRIQVDQGAYNSEKHKLCHLIFIFQTKCHKLQIQLFQAKPGDKYEDTLRKLVMNREVNLQEFGIKKPNYMQEDFESKFRQRVGRELTVQEEDFLQKQLMNDPEGMFKKNCLQVIRAIRRIKQSITGDIYKDFYHFGEPSTEDIDSKMWHGFKINFMGDQELQQNIDQKLMLQIRQKFLDSEAYVQMCERLQNTKLESNKNKRPIEKIQFAQQILRKRIKKKFVEIQKKIKKRNMLRGIVDQFQTVNVIQCRKQYVEISNSNQMVQKDIFLIIMARINDEESILQIDAKDQTREKRTILSFQIELAHNFYEYIDRNWDYFTDKLNIKNKCCSTNYLEFETQHLRLENQHSYRLSLQLFEVHNLERLEIIENEYDSDDEPQFFQTHIMKQSNEFQKKTVMFEDKDKYVYQSPRDQLQKSYSAYKQYKQLDLGMNSESNKKFRMQKSSNKKYNSIFENRKQLHKQQDFFKEFKNVKMSEEMLKYKIKNNYQYSILRIQKWWRKVLFIKFIKHLLVHNKDLREAGHEINGASLPIRQAAIETDLNMEKISLVKQTLRINGNKREMNLIVQMQKIFKLKIMIKKAREKFMRNTQKSQQQILFKCVREFYEDMLEMDPSNYLIHLVKDSENSKEHPAFIIEMYLNNKPHKQVQSITFNHDLNEVKNGCAESDFMLQHSQEAYFKQLIMERLKFKPYTQLQIRQQAHQAKKLKTSYDSYDDGFVDLSQQDHSVGEFFIEDFIKFTLDQKAKEVRRIKQEQEELKRKREMEKRQIAMEEMKKFQQQQAAQDQTKDQPEEKKNASKDDDQGFFDKIKKKLNPFSWNAGGSSGKSEGEESGEGEEEEEEEFEEESEGDDQVNIQK